MWPDGEVIERWWNGQWGMARRDIWLTRTGDRWGVWWCKRLKHEQEGHARVDMTEADARWMVDYLKEKSPVGRWTNITTTWR